MHSYELGQFSYEYAKAFDGKFVVLVTDEGNAMVERRGVLYLYSYGSVCVGGSLALNHQVVSVEEIP